MSLILPRKHFSFTSGDSIAQICDPLKLLGITHFHYMKLYPDESNIQLTNHPLFLHDFYAKGLYIFGCFEYANQCHTPGYILSSTLNNDAQKIFSFSREQYDIDHVIAITKKNKDSWEFYYFGGPKSAVTLPGFYLSNIDLLERFILYFHEKAERLIVQADKQRIRHAANDSPNLVAKNSLVQPLDVLDQQTALRRRFLGQLPMKKFCFVEGDQKITLTKRETDCLREWFKGYPAREIAQKLAISSRTVEVHIVHIKDKLRCDTKSQLIDKLRQNNFDVLLQEMHCD